MIPAAIYALAQLAPTVLGLFTKDETATKAAEAVSTVAQAITGKSTNDDALAALKTDPKLLIEYQNAMNAQAISMYQEETKRLESVNATIRAEAASADPFTRRWRPFYGYVVALTWGGQMGAISYLVIAEPNQVAAIINAMVALSFMWVTALSVLGVAVHERSKDKQVAAGQQPAGLLDAFRRVKNER